MKKILLSVVLFAVCILAFFFSANINNAALAEETFTDYRYGIKVGDDLSGATIYVDYSKLPTSFSGVALKTSNYAICRENAQGLQFCYSKASQACSPSATIKAWAYCVNSGSTSYWVSRTDGSILSGVVSYTLPDDFGVVTSITDTSMLSVSGKDVGKFKGLTYEDGVSSYAGLSLSNTMFAVKKPTFTKSFAEMAGSSDLDRVTLFSTTYSQLILSKNGDIIFRYSIDGGKTYTEKYLWENTVNNAGDTVYWEYNGSGTIYSGNFIEETTSWLRIITLETYTVRFIDEYQLDGTTTTKRRGEEISIPYINQPSTPLVRYEWECDKSVTDYHVTEDRTYTKVMYINDERVLTSYFGNMQTVDDGFPSMLKFYLIQRSSGYAVYVSRTEFQNIVDDKVMEGDKNSSKFVFKLHSLNTTEQNTNYLIARKTLAEVASSTVGAKYDMYWYALDGFDEVGTFDLATIAQVQLTVTMTFDEVIFNDYVDVPVQIYGNVKEVKNLSIRVRCVKYYNGEIDLKLPINFWNNYPELKVDDESIHQFVFEEDINTNWTTSDGYYVAKSIDTIYIKQNAFNFIFTNNLNDKTISLPINIDDDNNYYVVLMLDNPVQVNSDEFLAKNGWRDKFDSMSTLSDLKYCTEGAKTFIRSMLSCNNYSNYGFGQSGYYITGLPGHTVYSNTNDKISTVVGIKIYLTTSMITEYNRTYRLNLVAHEEYTQEENKIPSNWVDGVISGISEVGNGANDTIKTILCLVLSIVMIVVLGRIIGKLIGKKRK